MNACPDTRTASNAEEFEQRQRFVSLRAKTALLAAPLSAEDAALQSMPEASPSKWHLAHTSWFFEQFVLARFRLDYRPVNEHWHFLFNSYYHSVGPMHARPQRGLLSRPSLEQVLDYRLQVEERVMELLDEHEGDAELASLLELGLNHEQQHQELILTDILHLFSCNPLRPAYRSPIQREWRAAPAQSDSLQYLPGRSGEVLCGHDGQGFGFDNEFPRHRVLLQPHALAQRLVSNADYLQFIDDGGYRRHELWLSDGWARVQQAGWQRPLYWSEDNTHSFTLYGDLALDPAAPVCHVSFYEAEAFARWAGARLPSEQEWESAASDRPVSGNLLDRDHLLPARVADSGSEVGQLFGDCWEWTASPYVGYPGFRPLSGSLGEYNGKFMCGQWVLRGGSCVTPADHIRASYRNFFNPADRWQFMGIRLAKDLL